MRNANTRGLLATGLAALIAAGAVAQAPSGQELLSRIDAATRFSSVVYEGRMEIVNGKDVRVKTMRASALGDRKAFVEFTNPEDSGVKYLKIAKEMWMYFPEEQDTVKISGHLLKEGIMGSDVSYEDALESSTLLDKYDATVSGPETLDGTKVWILSLKAKVKTAPYDARKMWIDAERSVPLREEMYAKSGRLLKTSVSSDYRKTGDKWIAGKVTMKNETKTDSRTVMSISSIVVDGAVDESKFSLKELLK